MNIHSYSNPAQGGECVSDLECDAEKGFFCAPGNFSVEDASSGEGSVNASRCIQVRE
jgi:hypothetical protein